MLFLNWAFQLPLALILAFTLAGLRHGAALYRFLFFIPVILPVGDAGAALAVHLFRQRVRAAQQRPARRRAGGAGSSRWLSADGIVQWTTSFPAAWQFIGFFMVIFLAALAGIPEEYYEAAAIDGAGAWRQLARHHPARASNPSTSRR